MDADVFTLNRILTEALRLRGLGLCIIPIAPRSKTCPRGFKLQSYFTQRPRNRQIQTWFKRGDVGIAVVLGLVSGGLCCRDFDVAEAYHAWAAQFPQWAAILPTSRTGRGFHVYFRTSGLDPSLRRVRKAFLDLGDGELRIARCHAILPPSVHPTGIVYEWVSSPPWHGIPLVHNAAEGGLIPTELETGFFGAHARPDYTSQTCQTIPKKGAHGALFGTDGELSVAVFDELLGPTLPTGRGQRDKLMWPLARLLRTFDDTKSLPVDELEPIVRHWWQRALPVIGTKDWYSTWGAFVRAWNRARVPFGDGPEMREILDRAQRAGCPPDLMPQYGPHIVGLVASICRELALAGDRGGEFFLDCRTLGRLIGVSHNQATAYLNALVGNRVIRKVRGPEKGRATEYEYLRILGSR